MSGIKNKSVKKYLDTPAGKLYCLSNHQEAIPDFCVYPLSVDIKEYMKNVASFLPEKIGYLTRKDKFVLVEKLITVFSFEGYHNENFKKTKHKNNNIVWCKVLYSGGCGWIMGWECSVLLEEMK